MQTKPVILIIIFTLFAILLAAQEADEIQDMEVKEMNKKDNSFYKNGLTVKALLMDYQSQNDGDIGAINKYHHGFEVGYLRSLTDRISVGIPLKVGVVTYDVGLENFHKTVIGADIVGHYNFLGSSSPLIPYVTLGYGYVYEKSGHQVEVVNNLQASGGLGLKLKLEDRAYLNWESQYRYSLSDNRNNLHHGLGFLYYLGKRKTKIKKKRDTSLLDSDGDGIIDELDLCPQIAGLEKLQGCPDGDGDGIADYIDKCPNISGLPSMNGCPDTDGDGVSDNNDECPNLIGTKTNRGCPENDADNDGVPNDLDKCPTVAGPVANNGCPEIDTDGDGTPDNIDKCPNVRGSKNTLGCPDRDGDGIRDRDDRCPSTKGTIENNGCPSRSTTGRTTTGRITGTILVDTDGDGIVDRDDLCPRKPGLATFSGCPDSDGDGIDDSRDRCPNTAGTIDNGGCPRLAQIAQRDLEFLEIAMRSIQFESSKAELKVESYRILRQIAEIMRRYPDYNLSISGHTDNVGNSANNQILSENRAKACYQFLSNANINIARMNYAGYGESQPVSDNKTVSGRTLNRRVEFSLIPR
ncbi:MAG: thrombospondin type 3 repeat-containing protein [Saprospiraceae bacterium]